MILHHHPLVHASPSIQCVTVMSSSSTAAAQHRHHARVWGLVEASECVHLMALLHRDRWTCCTASSAINCIMKAVQPTVLCKLCNGQDSIRQAAATQQSCPQRWTHVQGSPRHRCQLAVYTAAAGQNTERTEPKGDFVLQKYE